MNKHKLLVLSNCPDFEYLGSGYIIANFTKQLRKAFEVDYFDSRDYALFNAFPGRFAMFRYPPGKLLLLIKLLMFQRRKYRIIEFWGSDSFLSMLFLRFFYPRILFIHHSNGLESKYFSIMNKMNPDRKWYHFNYKFLHDLSIKLPYGIVTLTHQEAVWAKSGYHIRHAVGINPCLNHTYLDIPIDFHQKGKVIGYVGTWMHKKGVDLIVSDLPVFLRANKDWQLLLIGVGEAAQILDLFPEDVRSCICVVPFVTDKQQLLELYKQMSIFILASRAESFGMVSAEAMAAGAALVASKMGFAADLVEGEEVLWIEEHNTGALGKQLDKLVASPALRSKLAMNGYKRVQSLNWDNAGEDLIKRYTHWEKEFYGGISA